MVTGGELSHLVPERIWAETEKALMEDSAHLYFYMLGGYGTYAADKVPTFFSTLRKHHYNVRAGCLLNLPLEQRLMLLTQNMEYLTLEENLYGIKVPNKLVKQCLRFNKLSTHISELVTWCCPTAVAVYNLLNDLDVFSNSFAFAL